MPGDSPPVAGPFSDITGILHGADLLFLLIGAVMIFSMHAGFAFLEVGSVRKKSQVNALNKIMFEWAVSTVVYFIVGYPIARGFNFWLGAGSLDSSGTEMVKFFLYLGFAACIPAIISGGVAERSKFWTNALAGGIFVGLAYPFLESICWGSLADRVFGGENSWLASWAGKGFHDYAGSVVVHSLGGWLALPAILLLGPRRRRYAYDGTSQPIRVSSIPFLALGSWILCAGWFGFNVMSAGELGSISALVAVNSLMAMVGGIIAGMLLSRNDAGFTHNGALAGLVAICAGSDLYHPMSALLIGAVAGAIFVVGFHVKGCGQQMGYTESYRGQKHAVNLLPKVCIRIAVNEEFVQPTIDAIVKAARSDTVGDGKIFVLPMERCIRIRTGEEGNEAVG